MALGRQRQNATRRRRGGGGQVSPKFRRHRNFAGGHFFLASALALIGQLGEARAAVQAGLVLDPTLTIRRFRAGVASDNPIYLAGREHMYDGMRKAGAPEG